jgi:tetratricopeptide (TPR) repeat protein
VQYVLEGSVRKAGSALRITAQLVDATTDTHLWVETYGGTLEDIFDIQEKVARQIAEALRLTLSPSEKVTLGKRSTVDPDAFDANLRARAYLKAGTKQDVAKAIELFKEALSRDTRYAAAYAGIAEAYATWFEFYEHRRDWLDLAIESALKALMYDANLPEAYAAMASLPSTRVLWTMPSWLASAPSRSMPATSSATGSLRGSTTLPGDTGRRSRCFAKS